MLLDPESFEVNLQAKKSVIYRIDASSAGELAVATLGGDNMNALTGQFRDDKGKPLGPVQEFSGRGATLAVHNAGTFYLVVYNANDAASSPAAGSILASLTIPGPGPGPGPTPSPSVLLVATTDRVLSSTDEGSSWSGPRATGLDTIKDLVFFNDLFIAVGQKDSTAAYTWSRDGVTWKEVVKKTLEAGETTSSFDRLISNYGSSPVFIGSSSSGSAETVKSYFTNTDGDEINLENEKGIANCLSSPAAAYWDDYTGAWLVAYNIVSGTDPVTQFQKMAYGNPWEFWKTFTWTGPVTPPQISQAGSGVMLALMSTSVIKAVYFDYTKCSDPGTSLSATSSETIGSGALSLNRFSVNPNTQYCLLTAENLALDTAGVIRYFDTTPATLGWKSPSGSIPLNPTASCGYRLVGASGINGFYIAGYSGSAPKTYKVAQWKGTPGGIGPDMESAKTVSGCPADIKFIAYKPSGGEIIP